VTWEPLSGDPSPDRLDACVAKGSLVETSIGSIPIEFVKAGDFVLTRAGYKRVLAARRTSISATVMRLITSVGNNLVATPDHRVWVENKGWCLLDSVVWGDIMLACQQSPQPILRSMASSSADPLTRSSAVIASITRRLKNYASKASARYMSKCGSTPMINAKSQRENLFIISMKTLSTMHQIIWSASLQNSTVKSIRRLNLPNAAENGLRALTHWLLRGTEATKVALGIGITGPKRGSIVNIVSSFVRVVPRGLNLVMPSHTSFAFAPKKAVGESWTSNISMRTLFPVPCVKPSSGKTNTGLDQRFVRASVLGCYVESEPREVYDLMVEDNHEFFADGLLVHNCVWALTNLMLDAQVIPFVSPIVTGSPRNIPGQ
jgi:hypothetical protein